uniref:RING-type domain-containing protein n=1 Tax=Panagrellus redivivus TaxID=6233 RepID=A0A7E4UT32_PANRE
MADCTKKRKLSTTPPPSASTSEPTTDVDFSKCCICYEIYNRTNRAPISVGCGHTFCQKCVRRITKVTNQKKTFSCPVCRSVSVLDMGDFTKNLDFIQALEKLNLLASDDTEEPEILPNVAQPNAPIHTGESDEDYSSTDSAASDNEDNVGVASGSNQNPGSNAAAPSRSVRGFFVPPNQSTGRIFRPNLPAEFFLPGVSFFNNGRWSAIPPTSANGLNSSQHTVTTTSISVPPGADEVSRQRDDVPAGSNNDRNQD